MDLSKNTYLTQIFLFLIFLVYCISFFIDVIDVDSAQYPAISMEMFQSNSLLEIKERGMDYLDKPPLIFWLSTISYKLFGINTFAYKLPSLLISILGIYSTFRIAKLFYNRTVAFHAVIILTTTIGYVWINSDIKTDLILTSLIVFTFWQMIEYAKTSKTINVLLVGVGIAFSMMAKGPIGFIIPVLTFLLFLYFKETRKPMLSPKLLLIFPVLVLLLVPMCYGLYTQFDISGNKVINGQVINSGLEFFFWTQSFGRITHENVFDNNTSFFFLWHTTLLLAIPWSLLLIFSFKNQVIAFWSSKKIDFKNHTLTIISLLIISMLSLSSYKIPHYAMIIFPFLAIIIAKELPMISKKIMKINYRIILSISLLFVSVLLLGFCMKIWDILLIALFFSIIYLPLLKGNYFLKTVLCGITISFMFNSFLLKTEEYSLPIQLDKEMTENMISTEDFYFLSDESNALEFFQNTRMKSSSINEIQSGKWYLINNERIPELEDRGFNLAEQVCVEYYDLNRINLAFINPFQKKEFLERCLVKIN